MIGTVIFDLFGTLIYLRRNSLPYLQLCRAVGDVRAIRDSLVVNAENLPAFCEQIGQKCPEQIAEIENELETDIADIALFDDTMTTIQHLSQRGIRIGLISNLASPYKRAFFNLGLDHFIDDPIFSCDVGYVKPTAEIYRIALETLGAKPESTLMVGDSQRADVDGPTASGIRGLLIDREGKTSGDHVLRALTDVTSFLNQ